MAQNKYEMLELLRFELKFLEDGGYGRFPRTPWRPSFIFEDSPSCLNLGDPARTHPCSEGLLMKFSPMNCRRRTRRAGLSLSMKMERRLIISIVAARSWKWKKPSPSGYAARSPGLNNNSRSRRACCRKNATNSPKRWHMGQDERGILDVLKMGRAAVHNPSAEPLPDEE